LLWALVIFLLVLLNAPVIRETLRGVEASNALYLLAVLLPLMYLLSLRRESDALGQLRWFQGSVWRQDRRRADGLRGVCAVFGGAALSHRADCACAPSRADESHQRACVENQGALGWLWTFVQAAVLAPIIEEFVFRGVLFQVFWQRTGRVWLSAFASGYLFAVIHPQFLGGILPITVLGTVLALVYAHTRSLLPCILIHALNNGLIVLMLWSVAG
jgi:membrane protease YdiL (CAAX protease family)